ncbi:MAG: hypothetical protein JWN25_3176 [Verrucomicrobiales bacterium]|nr:hypothetical protein [Verrucomicrobiales bacterium]
MVATVVVFTCRGFGQLSETNEVHWGQSAITTGQWIFEPKRDLRALFCSVQSVKDRSTRKVCNFDAGLEGKSEISISTNCTLRTVLNIVGGSGDGLRIRVIKKECILQSILHPLTSKNAEWEQFLKVKIDPGDLIVVCRRFSYGEGLDE